MTLKWTDVQEIAIALAEKFPTVDPKTLNFTNLYDWILDLEHFDDDPKRCGEKILEAIQAAWIDEIS